MKKSEAKPGTKVIATYRSDEWGDNSWVDKYVPDEYDDYTIIGVVRTEDPGEGNVKVTWIEGDMKDEAEEDVNPKVLSLLSDRSKLDEEFKAVEKEIKEKMKSAAALVREAGKLAKKHGAELQSMYDAAGPLVSAMDDNGWRSSSWGC